MVDQRQKRKNEFLSKTGLKEYQHTLFAIIDRILDCDCKISCVDTAEYSSCIQNLDDLTVPDHIRIGFGRPREKQIHFIWEILHEFGHHLSGKPSRIEVGTVAREELAWVFAAKEIDRYTDLVLLKADFATYSDVCLVNYRKRNKKTR